MPEYSVIVNYTDGTCYTTHHVVFIDDTGLFYVMKDRDGVVNRINRNMVYCITEKERK